MLTQMVETTRDGLVAGVRSWLRLAVIAFPVTLALALLQESGGLARVSGWPLPLTGPLGLPGEAALPLLTGLLVNKFAGISGLMLLSLTPGQYLVAAVFLALAHNLVLELMIVWQSRLPALPMALLRAGTAYLTAALVAGLPAWLTGSTVTTATGGRAGRRDLQRRWSLSRRASGRCCCSRSGAPSPPWGSWRSSSFP